MPATTTGRRAPTRAGKRKPSRRPAAKRTRPAKPASQGPGAVARSRAAAGRQLAGHWSDVGAIALVVLGALLALGLVSDLARPVGSGLADATGATFGRGRVAVPVACLAFAVLLLWPHRVAARERDDEGAGDTEPLAPEVPTVRIAIGALLLFVADLGVLHIAYGRPSIDGGLDDLRGAGGVLGAMVGGPLAAAAGDVGATVVLGGLAVVGLLLALGLSIGVVMSAPARATGKAAAKARTAGGRGLPGGRVGEDGGVDGTRGR